MQLEHSFSVPVGIDEAWRILIDIERIGPCMPGASIDSVEGDDFTGTVKVKLGPINLTYKGKASFVEKDETAHRAVIDARGRDARGNGTATAKVSASLVDTGGGNTEVQVNTDLDITGKPAQFGRGVMVDVGNKLIGQFADRLAELINRGGDAPETPADSAHVASVHVDGGGADSGTEAPPRRARPKPVRAAEPEAALERVESPEHAPDDAGAAGGVVDNESDDAEATPLDEETTPSYSVPGGVPAVEPEAVTSVNGHAPAGRPQADVEPINLLESAGPAVAKRLAPVAVGLVVVLIALRRRNRRTD